MGLIPEEDDKRYFVQLSLQAGKELLSKLTHYIHEGEMIPLYENFCYVLALVSSKQKENAEKAQDLLHRLLKFQIRENSVCKGAFPKYLHQYPYAKSASFQRDLSLVLEELLRCHARSLGSILTSQVKTSLKSLKKYLENNPAEGKKEDLPESSKELGNVLLLLSSEKKISFLEMVEKYACYWNPSLMCYTGPCLDEYYVGSELSLSCFDYLMANYYHIYPKRFKEKNLLQLQGALIPVMTKKTEFVYGEFKGHYKGMPFSIWNTKDSSLFFFDHFIPCGQESSGFHLFRYLWSGHHVVCQSKHMQMKTSYLEGEVSFVFAYPEMISEENFNQVELEFFVDYHQELSWSVDDKKATLFSIGDTLYLHGRDKILEWVFSIEDGKGDVACHISLGNRPSQIDPKASKNFEAFDWKLSLRTLRRTPSFKIKLKMKTLTSLDAYLQKQDCLKKLPSHEDHYLHTV